MLDPYKGITGYMYNFKLKLIFSLQIVLVVANSVDPDKMTRYRLSLHCLPTYLFRGFQFTKG